MIWMDILKACSCTRLHPYIINYKLPGTSRLSNIGTLPRNGLMLIWNGMSRNMAMLRTSECLPILSGSLTSSCTTGRAYFLIIQDRRMWNMRMFLIEWSDRESFSASEAFDGTYQTNVVVTSAGTCTYIPPGIFKSSCQIGNQNLPICTLTTNCIL